MLERDPKTLARLQTVVTALIEHRVSTSLVDVERALARWRSGAHSALAAHGAVLRHAARCERTVERVTAAAGDRPEGILRDAVDAGLMAADEFVAAGRQAARAKSRRSTRCATTTTRARPTSAARSSSCSRAARCSSTSTRAAAEVAVPAAVPRRREPRAALRLQRCRRRSPTSPSTTTAIAGTLTFAGRRSAACCRGPRSTPRWSRASSAAPCGPRTSPRTC